MEAPVEDDLRAGECPDGREVKLTGIVLAAGASSRMGSPKALLRLEGETFLDSIAARLGAACEPVIGGLGCHREEIRAGSVRADRLIFAVNPDPARGMLSSLQCGLRGVGADAAGAMFCPVDFPLIRQDTARLLAERFLNLRPPVALPEFRGRHGHPVCVAPEVMRELLELPLTAQARDVIHRHMPAAAILAVDDPGVVTDVDSPEDYRRLAQ